MLNGFCELAPIFACPDLSVQSVQNRNVLYKLWGNQMNTKGKNRIPYICMLRSGIFKIPQGKHIAIYLAFIAKGLE